jgi:5-methylcytosine-specific restriction endonuclease McrA
VKNRTPSWVNKGELLEIYANCPKGSEVDHIIPLKGLIDGRPVTGLHVPWNLQYLTTSANRKKHNRISEKDIIIGC